MNKLIMNPKGTNYISVFPVDEGVLGEYPKDEAGQIRWAEAVYKRLESDANAKRRLLAHNKKRGYMISVWSLDGVAYAIQCISIGSRVYKITVYVLKSESDAVAIAKFLQQNADELMDDYKRQILDARDWLIEQKKKEQIPHA